MRLIKERWSAVKLTNFIEADGNSAKQHPDANAVSKQLTEIISFFWRCLSLDISRQSLKR